MTAVITPLFHNNIAQSIYDEIQNRTAIYSYFLGKTLQWEDDDNPPIPSSYISYENDVRNNIIQTKQIQINDVSLVIPRINWNSGEIYDMYDDTISVDNPSTSGATSLKDSRFYVITEDFNIYKCLFNNNGAASTVEPTGTSYNSFETSDGYIWKFMTFIPLGLRNKFLTQSFVPITKSLKNRYYSNGAITGYNILDGGQNYDPNETYLVIQGDGGGPSSKSQSTSITYSVTVKNGTNDYGTGDKFYLDNQVSPSIKLIEGNTYVFDTSDESNTGHLLKFSTTADGIHDGGVEYTLGVTQVGTPGTPGSYTEITPGIGISDLYYYCENHSGMGNKVSTLFTAGENGQADIDLVIENGTITGLVINDGGFGYTEANAEVTKGPLDLGSGAHITFDLSEGDLNTQQSNVEFLAQNGSISHIAIEENGTEYTNISLSISGDGEGAAAEATLNANGEIEKVVITNPGYGYSYANIEISGNGLGGNLRAIISPKGGHGSNAPEELFADTLCFYSSFENELVQGYKINNDYRQIGIIKNLAQYGSLYNKFTSSVGSGLYAITGVFSKSDFLEDSEISTEFTGKKFKVIHSEDNNMLVQSLDGSEVAMGDVLYNSSLSYNFTVSSVDNPTINKFSGSMVYIDNKLAFSPSEEQFVVFRTFIKF